jgi:hypothetical protein
VRQPIGDVDHIEPQVADEAAPPEPPRPPQVARPAFVVICLAVTLVHLVLVFFFVAPANPNSQRLNGPIQAWVSPYFEQNWLLFAPNPESNKTQILARTGWTTATGDHATSDWFDISAVDKAGTRHNPYPSHTTQNMLRRAWSAYQSSHPDGDESTSDGALLRAKYLRNLAVQRVTPHSPHAFEVVQVKVVTQPIAPPGQSPTNEPYTRVLPWWTVTTDGN